MSTPVGLLDGIVRDALDPSYAQAAERHRVERQNGPNVWRRTSLISAALLLAAGAVAGIAISSEQRVIPQVGAARNALAGNAGQRTKQVTDLEKNVATLQREVAALQQRQLQATSSGRVLQRQAAALSAATAQTAVRGPGIRVTVTDAASNSDTAGVTPNAGERPQGSTGSRSGRVTDRDLQGVVNALWAGGAEAISVGGVRLGPQTAIRTAGQTILAGFQPLASPYRIDAIGGPGLLTGAEQAPAFVAFSSATAGTHPGLDVSAQPALVLPAAAPTQLDAGRPAATGGHS